MSNEEFKELVKRMRQAQKQYFKARSQTMLEVSKLLERQVDEAIKAMDSKQGGLF